MSKATDIDEIKKDTAVSEQGTGAPEKRSDNEELTKAVKALIARADRQYKLNKKICKWAVVGFLIFMVCLSFIAFYIFYIAGSL